MYILIGQGGMVNFFIPYHYTISRKFSSQYAIKNFHKNTYFLNERILNIDVENSRIDSTSIIPYSNGSEIIIRGLRLKEITFAEFSFFCDFVLNVLHCDLNKKDSENFWKTINHLIRHTPSTVSFPKIFKKFPFKNTNTIENILNLYQINKNIALTDSDSLTKNMAKKLVIQFFCGKNPSQRISNRIKKRKMIVFSKQMEILNVLYNCCPEFTIEMKTKIESEMCLNTLTIE